MKTAKEFLGLLLLWALRMATPAALLGMTWYRVRSAGDAAQCRALLMALAGLFVLRWADVEDLKSRVRDLEAPGKAAEQARRMVRERRKAGA